MQEIKLFGKDIPLSLSSTEVSDAACSDTSSLEETETEEPERAGRSGGMETSLDSATVDEEEAAKPESSGSREKSVKKPDKILPCPRCNSLETKFCYYNNYNVNQPRHFCKACQRYWTAGGTMRNVPVGAGRRKSKSSSSHYRHVTISEALQAAQIDAAANGIHHPGSKNRNGIVLKFGGVDPPVCHLKGTNKKVMSGVVNGFGSPKSKKQGPSNSKGENCDDCSSGSTVSAMSSIDEGSGNMNFLPQVPCIPGIPWPYPWNYPTVVPPPPALCHPGFGVPFYPAAFLNCSFQNNWNFHPVVPSNGVTDSHTLGKHPRDGEVLSSEGSLKEEPAKRRHGFVLVPKTLRVDDPNEAAKSTIWSTLGINKDVQRREGCFKGLDSKREDKLKSADKIPKALLSNPAALSRSYNFLGSSSA